MPLSSTIILIVPDFYDFCVCVENNAIVGIFENTKCIRLSSEAYEQLNKWKITGHNKSKITGHNKNGLLCEANNRNEMRPSGV